MIKVLTENDICQGANELGKAKDTNTWIDTFYTSREDRIAVERAIAKLAGVKSHSLIRWNDSTTKSVVATTLNKIFKEYKPNV